MTRPKETTTRGGATNADAAARRRASDAPDELPAWASSELPETGARQPAGGAGYRYTALTIPLAVDARAGDLLALGTTLPSNGPFAAYDAWIEGDVRWHEDADACVTAWREIDRRRLVATPTFLEPLDTYDADGRDPRQWLGASGDDLSTARGARTVTKAFVALVRRTPGVRGASPDGAARWAGVYDYLPWEDLRQPARIASVLTILSVVRRVWVDDSAATSEERTRRRGLVASAFGARLGEWNEERAGERYRVLHAAGLVEEARRDMWGRAASDPVLRGAFAGEPLAYDHRLMLADALGRLRGKMKYIPGILSALLGDEVALPELQRACEAIAGRNLHTANFRRALTRTWPLVRKLRRLAPASGPGPRAALYAFRRDIAQLRLDPSIRMPWLRLPPGALA